MIHNKIKKTISIVTSLALLANGVQPIHAADLVAIPRNVRPIIPPSTSPSTFNSEISIKSIETKISNVLNPEKTQPKVAATDDSGSCGNSVTYTFTAADGKLTISGSGEMTKYSSYSKVPWYSYKSSIKTVVIEYGVTSISQFAFYVCAGLTSVTIPASVKTIGSCAFSGCTGLTSVTIGNGVSYISNEAFSGCSSLTSITIPASVISIAGNAFSGCTGLTSITVNPNNPDYQSIYGVLFNKAGTTLISYPNGKSDSYFIPNYVTYIGGSAFEGCTGLTSVTIPDSVTYIGGSAFGGCTGLTSVTIPASVTYIGYYAFYDCTGLTSVTIPDSVTYIDQSAFEGCTGLTSVTIPDSVKTIYWSAFSGCTGLTSVTIPASVTKIGKSAFNGCTGLTSVTYNGTSDPGTSSSNVFDNTQVTFVNVPWNYKDSTFCGISISRPPAPTPSMSPLPTSTPSPSMSPLPTSTPTPSMSPLPTSTPTPSMSPLPTSTPTPSMSLNPDNSDDGSSNTALIASTVSIAGALIIAGITAAICYFKNPSSFPCFRKNDIEA